MYESINKNQEALASHETVIAVIEWIQNEGNKRLENTHEESLE